VIDQHQIGLLARHGIADFVSLPLADKGRRIRDLTATEHRATDFGTGRFRQPSQFIECFRVNLP